MRRLAFLLALALAACSNDLEKQSRVSKLRVLAVQAEPPELVLDADAGTLPGTTLQALAVDPADGGISLEWTLCARIVQTPAADLDCSGDGGIPLPPGGPPRSARLDLSNPAILAFAAAASDGGSVDAGDGVALSLDDGVPLLVAFTARSTASDGGPERLDGFATVTLRSAKNGPAGSNPVFDSVSAQDKLDGGLGQAVELDPSTPTPLRAHSVQRLTPAVHPVGRDVFSFYATAGELGTLRTTNLTPTGQTAPTWDDWSLQDAGGPATLWVVVRDGRGGTAWVERRVEVK